jgi:fructose 1,6-bisphosphate aldolase/phosphatase
MKVTLSVIKADIGGYVGHSASHPQIKDHARSILENAKKGKKIFDYEVLSCGDDLNLVLTHGRGEDSEEIHALAWRTFEECTEKARELKLYGVGQDLLSDTFSGNIKGLGPGFVEIEFEERESEPVIIFMADKTSPGAWNYTVYKIFADPFNTIGLVIDPSMHNGFYFDVLDVFEDKIVTFKTPEELYDMLVFVGTTEHYCVKDVRKEEGGEVVAASTTQKLNIMAGRYVGKDDPVLIVRAQHGFPAVGEILEPFTMPHLVEGWMRGSHRGPLMPVSFEHATPSRFDGPPRVIAAGFQLANGKLIGPRDHFDDPAFDEARKKANLVADYMRAHGPFEPHRLPLDEMEYTTLPEVKKRLEGRFKAVK